MEKSVTIDNILCMSKKQKKNSPMNSTNKSLVPDALESSSDKFADAGYENNQKKKRGRPRKNFNDKKPPTVKKYTYKNSGKNDVANDIKDFSSFSDQEDDWMILNLALTPNHIESIKLKIKKEASEYFEDNTSTSTIEPSSKFGYSKINDDDQQVELSISNIDMLSSDSSSYSGNYKEKVKLLLSNKDNKIAELEKENKSLKKAIEAINPGYFDNSKNKVIHKIDNDLKIIDNEGNCRLPDKAKYPCFKCGHDFSTPPFKMPYKVIDGVYYCFSNLCTFNCMLSYNYSMNDTDINYRQSLMYDVYGFIFKDSDQQDKMINAVPGPKNEIFERYGGPLPYNEYLVNCVLMKKEYIYLMPPLSSATPLVEETNKGKMSNGHSGEKNIVLKRSKPLPRVNSTTIKDFIG